MQKILTVTERPFAKSFGILSSLILPRSSMWKSVKKSKHGNVSSATYKICHPLYENWTYEAISNFDKGAKMNFMLNMASRSTVSLKPFASTRCFLVCQQNLWVELYNGSTTDLEYLVGFPKATVKLQTIKGGASIENVTISFNFVLL